MKNKFLLEICINLLILAKKINLEIFYTNFRETGLIKI